MVRKVSASSAKAARTAPLPGDSPRGSSTRNARGSVNTAHQPATIRKATRKASSGPDQPKRSGDATISTFSVNSSALPK
jgi:hypothetical protein